VVFRRARAVGRVRTAVLLVNLAYLETSQGPMPSFRTTRRVPFTPRQMFDLVADVERYPEFLPLCEGLTVRRREREGDMDILIADMTVGYKAIRETFTSRVRLDPARLEVAAAGVPGAMGPFSRLENRWQLRAAPGVFPGAPGGGCDVDFSIAYELRSAMLQMLVGALFDRAFARYTEAFEVRARTVYGVGSAAAREIS
jgi:coenzyme Q-binding protein COQ10